MQLLWQCRCACPLLRAAMQAQVTAYIAGILCGEATSINVLQWVLAMYAPTKSRQVAHAVLGKPLDLPGLRQVLQADMPCEVAACVPKTCKRLCADGCTVFAGTATIVCGHNVRQIHSFAVVVVGCELKLCDSGGPNCRHDK